MARLASSHWEAGTIPESIAHPVADSWIVREQSHLATPICFARKFPANNGAGERAYQLEQSSCQQQETERADAIDGWPLEVIDFTLN